MFGQRYRVYRLCLYLYFNNTNVTIMMNLPTSFYCTAYKLTNFSLEKFC